MQPSPAIAVPQIISGTMPVRSGRMGSSRLGAAEASAQPTRSSPAARLRRASHKVTAFGRPALKSRVFPDGLQLATCDRASDGSYELTLELTRWREPAHSFARRVPERWG